MFCLKRLQEKGLFIYNFPLGKGSQGILQIYIWKVMIDFLVGKHFNSMKCILCTVLKLPKGCLCL
jgi:hypothetical protein